MSLLSLVTTHYEQSLMDSASLSVVIAPNILPVENKLGGKKKKNETDLSYDIKNMTCKENIVYCQFCEPSLIYDNHF